MLWLFAHVLNALVCIGYASYFALVNRGDWLLRRLCFMLSLIAATLALHNAYMTVKRSKGPGTVSANGAMSAND